ETGRSKATGCGGMRAADQTRELGRRDVGGSALGREISGPRLRRMRMLRGGLQRAQAHLDAVVGGESVGDQRRQQDVGLAELLDDLRFHDDIDQVSMPSWGRNATSRALR